ncbi:AAA family ATPase [Acetonema longum]|uniref:DUF3696 domain-containing protein n=1 Tax=Acetonema longum DSM 6540 TaxID=1009370 RepID=F7NJG8_9FIRM|nr:DUF3696 domain-containing protein [Acetonema longum]EGO63798.1 hypothetical protein ALO_11119 [Acetonema longum DSM 6540]
MINKLVIKNFKCFGNQVLDFSPLTVLAGGNGAGKSSVIQSLLLLKRSQEIANLNLTNIELNGPYCLELGRASAVKSSFDGSNLVRLGIASNDGSEQSFTYRINEDLTPLTLEIIATERNNEKKWNHFRYLNAERIGPRKSQLMQATTDLDVGYKGEFTYFVLSHADTLNRVLPPELMSQPHSGRFSAQVEAWLQTIIPRIELKSEVFHDINVATIKFRSGDSGTDFYMPPATGFGITYVLPIVVAGLLASTEPGCIFIVENPEAHLHPFGQSSIGKFLALLSFYSETQIIIETHSEHVINGIRLQSAFLNNTDNLIINFFSHEEGVINPKIINVNKYGELSSWPKGFLDQEKIDLRQLLEFKRNV